jgi:hypothetical protein
MFIYIYLYIYIVRQDEHQLRTEVLNRFENAAMAMRSGYTDNTSSETDSLTFDWNTTYSLRLELLPLTHSHTLTLNPYPNP